MYISSRRRRLAGVLAGWLLLGLLLSSSADAENLGPGGGTRIAIGDQAAGPYRVLLTTSPDPAQIGPLTVVVRVSRVDTGEPVLNATVRLRLVHTGDGGEVTGDATHQDAGNDLDYVAHLDTPRAGMWEAQVSIASPAGAAQLGFNQRIISPRQTSTLLLLGLPFLLALGVLGGVWYIRSSSRPQS